MFNKLKLKCDLDHKRDRHGRWKSIFLHEGWCPGDEWCWLLVLVQLPSALAHPQHVDCGTVQRTATVALAVSCVDADVCWW